MVPCQAFSLQGQIPHSPSLPQTVLPPSPPTTKWTTQTTTPPHPYGNASTK